MDALDLDHAPRRVRDGYAERYLFGKWRSEHILMTERARGLPLQAGMVVHHERGRDDNAALSVLDRPEHARDHGLGGRQEGAGRPRKSDHNMESDCCLIDRAALDRQHGLLADPASVPAILATFGLTEPVALVDDARTPAFGCVLVPGARACLMIGNGGYRYVLLDDDDHLALSITLAEAFALLHSEAGIGTDAEEESGGWRVAAGVWSARLLAESGLVVLPDVSLPLPVGSRQRAVAFWRAVNLLYRCYSSVRPACPFALSRRFLSGWVGTSPAAAARGVDRLLAAGIVHHLATRPAHRPGCDGLRLFVPAGATPPADWVRLFAADIARADEEKRVAHMADVMLSTMRRPAKKHAAEYLGGEARRRRAISRPI